MIFERMFFKITIGLNDKTKQFLMHCLTDVVVSKGKIMLPVNFEKCTGNCFRAYFLINNGIIAFL